jgi:two-component system nitrate/nitrite response regulator NarL
MTKHPETINIMIAEDQGLIRHSLASLLGAVEGFEVIGLASNGEELLQQLETIKPDIVLMDIKMPKMNGIEVTKVIDEKMPWVKVIALSMFDHPVYIKEMLRNGAKGFISKNCSIEELCEAIRVVYGGTQYFCKTTSSIVFHDFTQTFSENGNASIHSLTSRELEIIKLLSGGMVTKEIASTLFISEKTVERHKSNLLKKLQLKNTAQLIKLAVEKGILIN